ncbi:amidohydrolase family protein [Jannaschia seohaensis]|uniref:5-methylthioadenosine/S-adenosylhomocysteine deaminase n=1 Tax=Jannaschia seohaensis TaxID=475081 RepID=A0A2Y9C734_9RHOB|nr:amidohydrolase family protein [Jannaschia seohaensis]PWJ20210.1 5-methylthioadenosine/S-adenosylhomocysteine deaminase [Jannaschia seohaensis]SSA44203.1 5-methylthioadenosine/S-adenosylhomocysteine deaminase [Jannaschia seohaensis]
MPTTTLPPIPDLLVAGATALTSDPARPYIEKAWIEVSGGRVQAIRESAPEHVDARTQVVPGEGRVVTPGFVNVHTHAILSMVRGVAEDMGFAPAYTMGVPHGHDVRPDEAYALAQLGGLEALCFGSTLINDSFTHQEIALAAMAETGLRAWGCGRIHDVDFSRVHLGEWTYDTKIGEWTLGLAADLIDRFHDPADLRTGVVLAPHAPDTCTPDLLRQVRELRDAKGLRINTHVAQSRVEVDFIRERDGMSPPELLDSVGLLDDRLIGAHCIHLSESDIARLGGAGAHIAHIAKGNQTHGSTAPTHALRRAGMNLALSTDNMHADMVELMRWALATGRLQEGRITEAWQPATVFEAATIGGARALGLDSEIGSIEEGKRADLVLFDFRRPHLRPLTNVLGTLVHTGQGRDVETVIVEGEVVVRSGEPVRVDRMAVIDAAEAAARALWARANAEAEAHQ